MSWREQTRTNSPTCFSAARGAGVIPDEVSPSRRYSGESRAWLEFQECAELELANVGIRPVSGYVRVAEVVPEAPFLFGGSDCYYNARSRGIRLCFASPQVFLCFCPGPTAVREHLGRDFILLLRPEFRDASSLAIFASVCERLTRRVGADLLVKGVSASVVPQLLKLGFRLYGPGESWSKVEPLDEETYPQVVWQPCATLQAGWPDVDSFVGSHGATLQAGPPEQTELSLLYSRWRAWFLARHPQPDPGWVDRYYARALGSLQDHDFVYTLRRKHDSGVLGLIAADRVAAHQLDGCVLLSTPGPWGRLLARLLYLLAGRLGYRYVNTGGSETASLHRFKSGFGRPLFLESSHLLYWGNRYAWVSDMRRRGQRLTKS